MKNFGREYRFAAGPAGIPDAGFEVGATSPESPEALHIKFSVDKSDSETPNTASVSLWNLSPEHLSILNEKDCVVSLRAGYETHMSLILVGAITYIETSLDVGDRETSIEIADGRIELRDCYLSLSYSGVINTKKIIEDIAADMGVTVTFSYNAQFAELPNGFAFVGTGRVALDNACASSGLQWGIQNGVLQVKNSGDVMSREVYVLSPETGLIGIPKKVNYGANAENAEEESGYEVEYFLNGAIGIGDYIRLESEVTQGYYRMRSVELRGDNLEGDWLCVAKLVEA